MSSGQLGGPISPGPVWTAETAWRLSDQPVVTIKGSERNMNNSPLDPVGVVRLSDGRYVVGDGNQRGWHAFLVYDSTGVFLEKWGGAGEGPGEFRQLYVFLRKLRGDTVAAYDQPDRAYELYTSDGKFAGQIRILNPGEPRFEDSPQRPSAGYGFPYGLMEDGTSLRPYGQRPNVRRLGRRWSDAEVHALHRGGEQTVAGRVRRPIWTGRDQTSNYQPFGLASVTEAGKHRWYYGNGEEFRVRVFDPAGRELHQLARDIPRSALTSQEKEEYIAQSVAGAVAGGDGATPSSAETHMRSLDYPELKAAFSDIIEDEDENVWVEHYRWPRRDTMRPGSHAATWSVFDPAGRFLGEVKVPPSFIVSNITRNQVLGFWQDDLDVKHVRGYTLMKPETRK